MRLKRFLKVFSGRADFPLQLHDLTTVNSHVTTRPEEVIHKLLSPPPPRTASQGDSLARLYPDFFDVNLKTVDLLQELVRSFSPRVVVETGVANGVSTRALLHALGALEESNSAGSARKLHSMDVDVSVAVPDLIQNPAWTFHLLESPRQLSHVLTTIGKIDMFFHDSDHRYQHQMYEYNLAWEHLNDGGILVTDDINWSNAFLDFCRHKSLKPAILADSNKFVGAVIKPVGQKDTVR